jgi:hypothetical protein
MPVVPINEPAAAREDREGQQTVDAQKPRMTGKAPRPS